jgi:hypothetical protein
MVSVSAPAFMATNDSKDLEGAIKAIKAIITVPDALTVFTYSYNEYQIGKQSVQSWNFEWTDKDNKNTVSASIDSKYNLMSYYKSSSDQKPAVISVISKALAIKNAEKFLKKAIPNITGEIRLIDDNGNYYGGSDTFSFLYQLFENQVPVSYATMRLGVDKTSGEVTSFWGWDKRIPNPVYPSVGQVLGKEAAKKTYLEKFDVPLKYYSYYDYQKRTLKIFAAYNVNDNIYRGIDAKTGEVIAIFNGGGEGGGGGGDGNGGGTNGGAGSQKLTKEEIDAVNNAMNLITKEKAELIIRSNAQVIPTDMKVNNSSLTKSYFEKDKLIWEISFESGYGSVNAKTGELISFYYYGTESGSLNMSKDVAKNKAEDFIKTIASDKFSQTRYSEPAFLYPGYKVSDAESYNFSYIRQVNGIDFPDNSINVTVSVKTGKILQYDCNWYENVSFPSVEKVMSKSAAFDRLNKDGNFNLNYALTDKEDIALIYNFISLDPGYYLDPVTGERLDWTGELYKVQKAPDYTDITGHRYEKTIRTLMENGYYMAGNLFKPNAKITQISFLKYLYTPTLASYKTDKEFYDMLVMNGIITNKEKKPDELLTRQDAAKFAARYMGYGKLATKTAIFKSVFRDNIDKEYIGYAAICYGMNVMKMDNKGYFHGLNTLTNGEASLVIFNLLNVK